MYFPVQSVHMEKKKKMSSSTWYDLTEQNCGPILYHLSGPYEACMNGMGWLVIPTWLLHVKGAKGDFPHALRTCCLFFPLKYVLPLLRTEQQSISFVLLSSWDCLILDGLFPLQLESVVVSVLLSRPREKLLLHGSNCLPFQIWWVESGLTWFRVAIPFAVNRGCRIG